MKSDTIQHKIKAFISSKCDDATSFKYAPIRKSLSHMLEETGMIETYCFETEPSTSIQLPDDYISELNDSQLLILLVDNKDGISDATLKEYQFAIAHQIKVIALFCDEYERTPTAIEKEIIDSGICHVSHVHDFSDMAFEAYRSVMQDLTKVYRQKPEIIKQDPTQTASILSNNQLYSFNISKDILNDFIATRQVLLSLLNDSKNNLDNVSPMDNGFSLFLRTVLCINKHNFEEFKQIETLITEEHNDQIKNIIKDRLDALNEYYAGNPKNALTILKTCLREKVKDNIVPEWLKNDIAIDIRNIEITTNGFLNSEGQEVLDNSKEYVHFPTIDRLANNIQTSIISFYTDLFQESPYASTTRTLEYIFNDITSYYCTALFYGSITHINIVKKVLQKLLFVLSLKQEDVQVYNKLLFFTVITNDEKQIENILRIKNPILLNFLDTKSLVGLVDNLPLEKERNISKLIILKHFGYILSDNEFMQQSQWFFRFTKDCIAGTINGFEYQESIVSTMKSICNRVPNKMLFSLIEDILYNEDKAGYFICKIIGCLTIKDLTNEQQNQLKIFFISLITKGETYKDISNFQDAVLIFCKNTTIEINDLIKIIEEKTQNLYHLLKFEIYDKDKKSSLNNIKKYISNIVLRIESQKKGSYIGYSNNPFITIKNIIEYNKILLNAEEIKLIVEPTTEFLLSNAQSYGDKCSALELLIFLANKFYSEYPWRKTKTYINKNLDKLFDGESFILFDKTTVNSLKFHYQVLTLSVCTVKNIEIIAMCASLYSMTNYDKIICLKLLSTILESTNKNIKQDNLKSILQLSIAMLKDKEQDVRILATKCLIAMIDSSFNSIIMRELSAIMNIGDIYSKRIILIALKKKKYDSKEAEFIIQKAKTDRNYYIREVL